MIWDEKFSDANGFEANRILINFSNRTHIILQPQGCYLTLFSGVWVVKTGQKWLT